MSYPVTRRRWRVATRASVLSLTAIAALVLTPTSLGATRSGVAALQVALKSRGLYRGEIDGVIGPRTIAAVRVFQRRHRLTVDGIPGPVTCAALGRYSRHRLGTRTLMLGDSGWDVAETQFLLRSHGYSPGPLDGSYGTLSVAAVRRFQRHSALEVDGVVGPATLASLDGERANGPGGLTTTEAGQARAARRLVIVRRDAHRLYFYRGARPLRVFTVATGGTWTPTPPGRFRIVVKYRHPWWYPPNSSWAKHLHPIPPGPDNPLGTRWMGLSVPGVGIHGTPYPASLGYSVSHGCIRMEKRDAEALFRLVRVGTRVWII
jgi:L,D-transpeptidase catalytic domain/Putative peptidoglycan binding domain